MLFCIAVGATPLLLPFLVEIAEESPHEARNQESDARQFQTDEEERKTGNHREYETEETDDNEEDADDQTECSAHASGWIV